MVRRIPINAALLIIGTKCPFIGWILMCWIYLQFEQFCCVPHRRVLCHSLHNLQVRLKHDSIANISIVKLSKAIDITKAVMFLTFLSTILTSSRHHWPKINDPRRRYKKAQKQLNRPHQSLRTLKDASCLKTLSLSFNVVNHEVHDAKRFACENRRW